MTGRRHGLFYKGGSAFKRYVVFSLLALVMLIADAHWQAFSGVRQLALGLVYPVQSWMNQPLAWLNQWSSDWQTRQQMNHQIQQLQQEKVQLAVGAQRYAQQVQENEHLRRLLNAPSRAQFTQQTPSVLGELLYAHSHTQGQSVWINVGQKQTAVGRVVMGEQGMVGVVSQTTPLMSRVTLVTDESLSIPVQLLRTGMRAVTLGMGARQQLQLRFMPQSADIKVGDVLVTSGLDGLYPAGIPVAKVQSVARSGQGGFSTIICTPLAAPDQHRFVWILGERRALPPIPADTEASTPLASRLP